MHTLKTRALLLRKKPLFSRRQTGLLIVSLVFCAYISGLVHVRSATSSPPLFLQSELLRPVTKNNLNSHMLEPLASAQSEKRVSQIQEIAIGQSVYTPQTTSTPVIPAVPAGNYSNAREISPNTWTVSVGQDSTMATPAQIYQALNAYRQEHGVNILAWDNGLASFAQSRSDYYVSSGKLDDHAGFINFLNNQNGFEKLGYENVGENASLGFTLSGTHLINEVYAADAEHNANQLNSQWTAVGIGVTDKATDLVFGGQKM